MSIYYLIYADANDGYVSSLASGSGSSPVADSSATSLRIGGDGTRYHQSFLAFDTSAISSAAQATFSLKNVVRLGGAGSTSARLRYQNWGTAVETGDYASLASLTTAGSGTWTLDDTPTTNTIALSDFSEWNNGGTETRFNLAWVTVSLTNGWTGASADTSGTTSDPSLLVTGTGAWAFVGVSNVVEVATTAHALVTTGIVGTLQAGDLLVACISSRIASTTSVTLPTGGEWTLVSEQKNNNIATNNTATPSGLMAYCVRGASNPNLTFTHPTAPSVAIGRIIAYRNVDTASPKDTQTSFTTATAITAVSGTGLSTTQDDDLIVAMACGGQEAAWQTFGSTDPSTGSGTGSSFALDPESRWRERADSLTTTGADTSLAIFDAVKTTTGATGNLTATASVSAAHVVVAGAFKIAAAAAAEPRRAPVNVSTAVSRASYH